MTRSRAAHALLVVALAAAPFIVPQFWITLGNYIGLYSIVTLGLVLLTGVAGQTSFGQAAFVGLGAYTTAYLTTRFAASPWLALAIGLAITAAVALTLGFITLRMKGHYLPLATIAWGISLYFLFGNLDFLGGHTGMTGIPALFLSDMGDHARCVVGDRQSAGLAHGPRDPRTEKRSGNGRSIRRQRRATQDRRVHLCRAARVRLRLALRASAAIRESDAVRHQ